MAVVDGERLVLDLVSEVRWERVAAALQRPRAANHRICTGHGSRDHRSPIAILEAGAAARPTRADAVDLAVRAELFHLVVSEGAANLEHTAAALRALCGGDQVLVDQVLVAAGAPLSARPRACGLRV